MSSIADLYNHLKTLCSQWFYTKNEVYTKSEVYTKYEIDNSRLVDTEISSDYYTKYGFIVRANLYEHLQYIESKIPSDITVATANGMVEILSHIDDNWDLYQ